MVRPLPLPAPASGLVVLLERAAERFGEEYFRVRLGNWYFLGGAHHWAQLPEDGPEAGALDLAAVVEACRWAALPRGLRLEMMDGLGLAGVCTPDGEQLKASRGYDPFDPVGRAKAALEALLEATDA